MIEYTVRIYKDGSKYWHLNGKRHREDGPAVEYSNGTKVWYLNGKFHREDGPAIEHINGTNEWWVNGERVTQQEVEGSCQGKTVVIDGVEYQLVKT